MKALALVLALAAPLSAQWYSGDSHIHIQQCTTPVNLSMQEVYDQMTALDMEVGVVQLWGSPWTPVPYYLSAYAPLITGLEDPISDETHHLQIGLEVSGFPASQFGHLQIIQPTTGFFPTDALYPGPILDFYNSALNGYAHVSWFSSYETVPFYAGTNGAYMAPIDAALGTIDFLETTRVEPDPGLEAIPWMGIYYKLLNSGLHISLMAGSDNSCFVPLIGDGQTHAWVPGPLSFASWCDAVRKGRTTISQPGHFLSMTTNTEPIGSYVKLPSPGFVVVNVSDACDILMNGVIVASPTTAGPLIVPISGSCWLAAHNTGAHTAATYVIVADEPITSALDAQYWMDYCDSFTAALPIYGIPTAEPAMAFRIAAAKQVYAAHLARALPWPTGVSEYGASSNSCQAPISIGITSNYSLDCINAPPNASGFLVLGVAPASVLNSGITLLVNPFLPYALVPVQSSSSGYCRVPINTPSGKHLYAQFVWQGSCTPLCSSDGLDVIRP